MKKIQLLALAALASVSLLTGCQTSGGLNPPTTVAIVRASVSTGALFGMEKDPTIVPYLQAATPIICNAAGQGEVDPAQVVQALQSIDPSLKNATGVAVINGGLAIYEAVYSYYGTNVQASVVQPYLEGVCLGLRDAVPTPGNLKLNKPVVLPPHIR